MLFCHRKEGLEGEKRRKGIEGEGRGDRKGGEERVRASGRRGQGKGKEGVLAFTMNMSLALENNLHNHI